MSQQPLEIHFDQEDGLPTDMVYRAIQDHEGYMWFCTDKGISKFDGYTFTNYTIEDGLPYNDIYNFHLDYKGRIWLATFDRICYVENDSIHELNLPEGYEAVGKIRHFFSENKKQHVINFIDDRNHYLTVENDSIKVHKKLENHSILIVFNDGQIAFRQGPSREIIIYNPLKGTFERLSGYDFDDFGRFFLISSTRINESEYLRGHHSIGILNIESFRSVSNQEIFGKDLKVNYITAAGKYIYLKTEDEQFVADENLNLINDLDFMLDQPLSSFFIDKDGNTWTCSPRGVNYYLNNQRSALNYHAPIANELFSSLTKDHKGNILVTSQKDRIYKFDKNKGFEHYLTTNLETQNKIYTNHKTGEEIVADFNLGVFRVLRSSTGKRIKIHNRKRLEHYTVSKKNFEHIALSMKDLDADQNGDLAIAFAEGVVLIREHDINLLFDKRSYSVKYLNDTLWIGTINGLYKSVDESEALLVSMDGQNPYINNIQTDEEDVLWLSTKGAGLWKYAGEKFEQIPSTQHLLINNFYVENTNHIWLATNDGLYHLIFDENGDQEIVKQRYGKSDGLPSQGIKDVVTKGDDVYVLSSNHVSVLAKRKVLTAKHHDNRNVQFTSISVNGRENTLSNQYDLHYKENNIEIGYSLLMLSHLGDLTYKWKVDGLTDFWTETKNTSQMFYELPPGKYDFQVKGFDSNENQIGTEQSVSFTIEKPWYNTYWFYGLCFLSIIGGFWIYEYTKRKREKERAELEAAMQKEFYELRLQTVQAQLNPHFVFNALNSIQKFIYQKEPEEANQYIVKFAKLMRAILESTSKNYVFLREELDLIQMYVSLEKLRFDDHFDYEIKIDDRLLEEDIKVPSTLVQPFIENAINHGIALKEEKANLLIQVEKEGSDLVWIIQDDGVGRKEALKRKKSTHVSRAIQIIEERKEILKQRDDFAIDFSYVDLTDLTGKGIGTRVIIRLPIDIT